MILNLITDMKINIIISNRYSNSSIDANIISFLLKKLKLKQKATTQLVYNHSYSCPKASINIFFGSINPLLVKYAKTNILLFDHTVFPKSHLYMLKNMYILRYILHRHQNKKIG